MSSNTTLERAAIAAIAFSLLPPIGQPLEGGIFAGITTCADGTHVAVVLLTDKPSRDLNWKGATAWAETVGGQLPTRPVAALLFANLKAQFTADWHWTCEAYGGSGAWMQTFYSGYQDTGTQKNENCARAVRMIPLTL